VRWTETLGWGLLVVDADALPVGLDSGHSSAREGDVATRCVLNVTDARVAVLTIAIDVVACP
jgi:hypothetical protein